MKKYKGCDVLLNQEVLLHNHSTKSLLDSILQVDDMIQFCIKNNYPAIALTDHGNMHEFVNFYKASIQALYNIIDKHNKKLHLDKKEIEDIKKQIPKDKSIKDEIRINKKLQGYQDKYPKMINECLNSHIKPIIGCETYEVDDMSNKHDTKEYSQPRYHLLLLAKNNQGLKDLFKIVTASNEIGFYKKPRIDLNYIEENNLGKNIICLTACQAGRLSRQLALGKENEMVKYVQKLKNIFNYVSIEIQSHNTESQIKADKLILNFAHKYNLPYVITTDSHMARKDQQKSHSIFVAIGEGREVGESYDGCYLQTTEEIYDYMSKSLGEENITQAIQETLHINNMIDWVDIGLNNENQMPIVTIPNEFKTHEQYLRYLVLEGFKSKFNFLSLKEKGKRKERIEMELPILNAVKYTDYFIMLYMLAREADKRKIPRGYSRGSGANCLCLFCLGVTQVDSIKWDLDFSRFANLGRTSMADFDFDISKRRRKEMVEISEQLFGKDKVAPICTFNTLSTKVAIRDIGKVLDEKDIYKLPYKIRDEVAKMIPTIKTLNDLGEEEEKETLLKEVLFKDERLKRYYSDYPLWFKYVMELEGLPKSLGRHAAGTLITPKPVIEYCPMCLDKDGNLMAQLEMHNAMDDLKLIKMDYLGLKNLDIIDDTLKMSGITWQDVDINHINLNDKNIYDNIYKQGNTIGIFQMESAEATKMCQDAKADNIEDIIAINAFNRPGTKDSFPTYIQNKLNPDNIVVIHEDLRKILMKTFCTLLYQEQTLQIFRYAGFPESEVDNARRAIGKKKKDVMIKLKDDFISMLKNKEWNVDQIDELWSFIEKQALYSFNRGHSVAYGLLSYLTAFLKYYHPLEFMTASLISDSGNVSKISVLINECNRLKIKVCPPNINYSNANFTAIKDKNEILFGFLPIKGVGESVVNTLIKNRPYKSLENFLNKINNSEEKISTDIVIALIKSGALPCKNKRKLLIKYFESCNPEKIFSPLKTTPTLKILKEKYNIDEKDKNKRLALYNQKRRQEFIKKESEKHLKKEQEFSKKYLQNEYMWEFETLSMFLTNNPLEGAYKYVRPFNEINNNKKTVVIGTIINIQRKKDKNNNTFAYLSLYTPFGIIEAICWASKYSNYRDLIAKGNNLAILGRKNEDKLFVEEIKSFQQWKKDMKIKI